jgi:hypothetical protein
VRREISLWARPTVEELRQDLREITRRIRPDFDLATPGLREKWERGERGTFFPYGRSLKDVFAGEDAPAEKEREPVGGRS